MSDQLEWCATCGEDIPDGEAEFDQTDGHIGLPHHSVCLSMPLSLKGKLAVCPACGHMEGRHMECEFDETTWRISNCVHARCANGCGCDWYLS